jgi:hypothetical protein
MSASVAVSAAIAAIISAATVVPVSVVAATVVSPAAVVAVIPRADADEDASDEVVRPVVAVGSARVRSVGIVTVRTARRRSVAFITVVVVVGSVAIVGANLNADGNLRGGCDHRSQRQNTQNSNVF